MYTHGERECTNCNKPKNLESKIVKNLIRAYLSPDQPKKYVRVMNESFKWMLLSKL